MKIGIIGGSGLDDPKFLDNFEEKTVETKYGKPSSTITSGKLQGTNVELFILSRHGKKHEIPPSQINYRANIAALKKLGCNIILASSAVGSLKEEISPGDLVFPDQFIDFTKQRKLSFYDEIGEVVHLPLSEPFSERIRKIFIETAEELNFNYHPNGTIIVIEGPRFSTKAESFLFRGFADIIGMTTVPECQLAREAEIEYQSIAMATDYDCWRENTESVTFEMVKQRMAENADKVKKMFIEVIKKLDNEELLKEDREFLKSKIRTITNWPKQGIMFRDITTLLKDGEAFSRTIKILEERYKGKNIDLIAGIESRGFIIASALASRLNKPFIPIRKPGKLPAETIAEQYSLEYGTDAVEIHKDAIKQGQNVLLIDDLCATGGTSLASCNLIEKLGGKVVECCFVIDLPDLGGSKKLRQKYPVFKIIDFEGE
jgi:5'-methylthioadenosine phosphorylase